MTIQHTTWSPNTCNCTVTYAWDDELEDSPYTLYSVDHKCASHTSLSDEDCWTAVTNENRTKNAVQNTIMDQYPDLDIGWIFDSERNLIFTLDLDENAKSDLRTSIELANYPITVSIA